MAEAFFINNNMSKTSWILNFRFDKKRQVDCAKFVKKKDRLSGEEVRRYIVMEQVRDNGNVRTPRNKKQIGKIGKGDKIYIEDYAVTYLNQIARISENENGFAGLFGTCREVDGIKEYYIYAAIYQSADNILEGGLPREGVQKIMRKRAELFTEYFFLGWALMLKENSGTMWESCYRSRLETLMGKPEVLMTLRRNSCEEHFYLYPTEMPKETEGYFIFYEQNDAMQNYLIEWHGTNHNDKCDGDADHLAESCRNYYKEKKAVRFKNRMAGLALVVATLLLIFATGFGIEQLNDFEKMQEVSQSVVTTEKISEIYDEVEKENYVSGETASDIVETEYSVEVESEDAENSVIALPEENISEEDVAMEAEEGAETEEAMTQVVLQEPAETEYMEYEVVRGDTLYDICIEFYGDLGKVQEICVLNHIENMDNILYGEKILLPR